MARLGARRATARKVFSPHTRGWPGVAKLRQPLGHRSPRTRGDGPKELKARKLQFRRSPRTRGDGPCSGPMVMLRNPFSPHTRGWPVDMVRQQLTRTGSPRTRGDGPADRQRIQNILSVLPAHAGMARGASPAAIACAKFSPHTRG